MAIAVGMVTVSVLVNGKWVKLGECGPAVANIGSVIGGSLDGARMVPGTKDGQTLVWSADKQRWIDKACQR